MGQVCFWYPRDLLLAISTAIFASHTFFESLSITSAMAFVHIPVSSDVDPVVSFIFFFFGPYGVLSGMCLLSR